MNILAIIYIFTVLFSIIVLVIARAIVKTNQNARDKANYIIKSKMKSSKVGVLMLLLPIVNVIVAYVTIYMLVSKKESWERFVDSKKEDVNEYDM